MMTPRPIRLADVAKAAGVSRGTASNVFSRPDLVREEVRERVKAAAAALSYSGPDPKGRLLRAGKVNAIGVATAEPLSYFFEDPFARVMMRGISEVCDARGAGIALVSAANSERLAWNIKSALVDGFILFCIESGSRLVELTRERGLPFIALELAIDDPTISAIGIDNIAGARLAADHLARLAHRRFAVLAMPFADDEHYGQATRRRITTSIYSDSRHRVEGYFAGLSAAGIPTDDIPVFETGNEEVSVRGALAMLFGGRFAPPTALLAMSDRIALIALDWLADRGIRVPADVSIVGFDGVPDGTHSNPPLTTVAQPIGELGRRAVLAILDHDGTVRRDRLAVDLLIRGSTGPAPA